MDHPVVFDQVLEALGFRNGSELAAALGRKRQAASEWRRNGFPKARRWDLQELARERGAVLPNDFFRPDAGLRKRQGVESACR